MDTFRNSIYKVSQVITLITQFIRNYFWGIVWGALVVSALGVVGKLVDTLSFAPYLENSQQMTHELLDAAHKSINVYWGVMGKVDIIVLVFTITLVFLKENIITRRKRRYF